jgi:transposase-like protein
MNLSDLMKNYNCDDKCREYLEQLRWPTGPVCPKCDSKDIARIGGRESVLRCKECQHQFTVTVGSVFQDSHLPLTKWFLATHLICEAKKGISALQIQRTLGIGGYKTAWHLCHRIRSAMMQTDSAPMTGVIEMDETYIGGHKLGRGWKFCGRADKEPVIGIRQRNGELRLFHASEVTSGVLAKYIRENVSDDAECLITDDSHFYKGAAAHLRVQGKHKTIRHSEKVYVRGDIHTNTIESAFSLLKRGIIGSWHRLSAKHLAAYCDEMCFRFNQRKNPALFSLTLCRLLQADTLTFDRLTGKKAA